MRREPPSARCAFASSLAQGETGALTTRLRREGSQPCQHPHLYPRMAAAMFAFPSVPTSTETRTERSLQISRHRGAIAGRGGRRLELSVDGSCTELRKGLRKVAFSCGLRARRGNHCSDALSGGVLSSPFARDG